jgi:hypothetical protein
MSIPSSVSLSQVAVLTVMRPCLILLTTPQSSSKSGNLSTSSSSRRSSLLKARVANAFNFVSAALLGLGLSNQKKGKKKRGYVDASVVDASHGEFYFR